ncbi:MAG: PEGA domain-containing protein [Polyangia bacterium]
MRDPRLSSWFTAMAVLHVGLLWGELGTAQAADRRLAVLEFQGSKVDDETLKTFADAVRGGALEGLVGRGIDVMTRENMMAMLKAMGKSGCSEGECEVETARNIGADYVVSGSVTHIENLYVVTLKIHESKGGTLLATDMLKGKTQVEVLDQLREHGRDLLRASLGRSRSALAPGGREKRIEADGEFAVSDDRVLVKFESEPSGATVLLDGELLCKETPCSRSVLAGRHQVEMHKERFERAQQAIEAKKGTAVHLTLPANFATLVIRTDPAGLPVAVDGKILAEGPLEIDPGQHEVVIDQPCFQRSGEQVVLKKGERREITVTGSPRLSAIAVTAENERGDEVEAKVVVDDAMLGTTPGTFKVSICSKEVRVSSETGSFRSALTLVEKETSQVRARLWGDKGELASKLAQLPQFEGQD